MDKRFCDNCGKYMTRGYVIENGMEYYCGDNCLHTRYAEREYLELYDDGNGDSYYTEWEDEIENEIEFLTERINDNDFFGFKKTFDEFNFDNNVCYENELKNTLNYCLYDGYFNPYYSEEYLDVAYIKNKNTGLIYNIDDIYDVFYNNLKDIKNEMEVNK